MQGILHSPGSAPSQQGNVVEFRRMLKVIPAAAYTTDAEGLITGFNQHAVTVWGRAPVLNDPVDRY